MKNSGFYISTKDNRIIITRLKKFGSQRRQFDIQMTNGFHEKPESGLGRKWKCQN